MKITNSNQINIKFKNRDHLTTDQVKGKPIIKGDEIVGVIDYYELHVLYWGDGTDILTAKSSLYIVGNWTSIPEHTSFFSREILLAEQPVFECLKAAEKDYKENI